ncbi:hypothetical protein HNP37_004263 [Flavobacterium nitrogenifigens]|uniref:YcxB-like protein n=2 Tax=Flavobacterium TaxID=237 RepID=A0A7W7J1Q8_9FLAO|nr:MULTISPECIES: hypothetical protein [Flavobacterium]MBB4804177.1 hypothetical protein [Flavobacterium nitrogenifigens]MBB6389136.1 hypothetical protein [Flavobacterium notoginsengisoli]
MTTNYQLDENDFLQYQLYTASKSERIKKKRLKSKIIIPIIYGLIVAFDLYKGNTNSAIVFLAMGILWFFLYPFWDKRHYIKHYKGFIKENYQNRFNKVVVIEFADDFISSNDISGSEMKIATSEIEEINEISSSIFIKFNIGNSLILPKNKIQNNDDIILFLRQLANSLNIKYNIENDWKWK